MISSLLQLPQTVCGVVLDGANRRLSCPDPFRSVFLLHMSREGERGGAKEVESQSQRKRAKVKGIELEPRLKETDREREREREAGPERERERERDFSPLSRLDVSPSV